MIAVSRSDFSGWWRVEVESDPAYESVVTPLLLDVLEPTPDRIFLDLGCGEGRVMRTLQRSGVLTHGVDLSFDLVHGVPGAFVADVLRLPSRAETYDGVYSVLTLEHIEDHASFFRETIRVTKPGGVLALVMNHPHWTAPDSSPITDEDGEVLWRPGEYFTRGSSEVKAGGSSITFYHRPMSDLLNAAAHAGWSLRRMVERPHHEYHDQAGILRLLACRWIAPSM